MNAKKTVNKGTKKRNAIYGIEFVNHFIESRYFIEQHTHVGLLSVCDNGVKINAANGYLWLSVEILF